MIKKTGLFRWLSAFLICLIFFPEAFAAQAPTLIKLDLRGKRRERKKKEEEKKQAKEQEDEKLAALLAHSLSLDCKRDDVKVETGFIEFARLKSNEDKNEDKFVDIAQEVIAKLSVLKARSKGYNCDQKKVVIKDFVNALASKGQFDFKMYPMAKAFFEKFFEYCTTSIHDMCSTALKLSEKMRILQEELTLQAHVVDCFLQHELMVDVEYGETRKTPLIDALERNLSEVVPIFLRHKCDIKNLLKGEGYTSYLKKIGPHFCMDYIKHINDKQWVDLKLIDPACVTSAIAQVKEHGYKPTREHVGVCYFQNEVRKRLVEEKIPVDLAPFYFLQGDLVVKRLFQEGKKEHLYRRDSYEKDEKDQQALQELFDEDKGADEDFDNEIEIVTFQPVEVFEYDQILERLPKAWEALFVELARLERLSIVKRRKSFHNFIVQVTVDLSEEKHACLFFKKLFAYFYKQIAVRCKDFEVLQKKPDTKKPLKEILSMLRQECQYHAFVVDECIKKGLPFVVTYPDFDQTTSMSDALQKNLGYVFEVLLKHFEATGKNLDPDDEDSVETFLPLRRKEIIEKIESVPVKSLTEIIKELMAQGRPLTRKNIGNCYYKKVVAYNLERRGIGSHMAFFCYLELDHFIADLIRKHQLVGGLK